MEFNYLNHNNTYISNVSITNSTIDAINGGK